jgi:hypothetical protein
MRFTNWTVPALIAVLTSSAGAQEVTISSPTGTANGSIGPWSITGDHASGWNVSFTATVNDGSGGTPGSFQVQVRAINAGVKINYVRVTTARGSNTNDWVGVSVFPDTASDKIPFLGELTKVSGSTADLAVATSNIGQLGSATSPAVISANSVSLATHRDTGTAGYTGDAFVTVTTLAGNFMERNVDLSIEHDLLGSVSAGHNIGNCTATGNIGSATSPVTLTAGDHIDLLKGASIWAAVSTTNTGGSIKRIQTTSGSFVGSASTDHMDYASGTNPSGLTIAGDLDADVAFASYTRSPSHSIGGALVAGRTLSMGGGWPTTTGGQNQCLTVNDLRGQIIINASNGANPWTGSVIVGSPLVAQYDLSSVTTAPYYTPTSSDLGGGAVGLAPFHLHDTDCAPPNNGTIALIATEATLRFYGPIRFESTPLKVEYQPSGGGRTWYDITGDFTFEMGSNDRELLIVPITTLDFAIGVTYRVTPVDGALRCRGITDHMGGEAKVDPFIYTVTGPS